MNAKKFLLAISIVFVGILTRIFLNEVVGIPNFEAVTAISLISGSLLGGIFAAVVPLFIIFISDIYFGNTLIHLFTWSAFILIGIFGILFKKSSKYYFLKITGGGIISVLFFYLWTNFGWWLVSGMYPLNSQGLLACYAAAIPFLKNQLMSILIFVPALALIFTIISEKLLAKINKKNENLTFISRIS
jgi:hypothetical protein